MDEIVKQLIELNKRDWLDIVGILVPLILTVVVIIQNRIYSKRTDDLQKAIHNSEQKNRYHDDIFKIYSTYYLFCDAIFESGFAFNVRSGNVNLANVNFNKVVSLRSTISRNLDLAKLIFEKSNNTLYKKIEDRIKLEIDIIDLYLKYIDEGKLYEVSEKAWDFITAKGSVPLIIRYDYFSLMRVKDNYDAFLKLCESDEIKEIEKLTGDLQEKHNYENYDKYFEEYFSLNVLS